MSVMRSSDGLEWVLTRSRVVSSALLRFGMKYPPPGEQGCWWAVSQRPVLAQRDLVGLQVVAVHLDTETRQRGELEAAVRIIQWPVYKMIVLAQVPFRGFELVEIRNGHHHLSSGHHVDRPSRVV